MANSETDISDDDSSLTGNALVDIGLDAITDAVTGVSIPKPIKRNVFKAFGRLCSAAVEVPAAYFEGVVAVRKAETAARVKLIETNASQIAHQMEVNPEYARIAVRKFGQKILREQVNLDMVSEEAAKELNASEGPVSGEEVPEIDDDWLNHFEKEASQRSSEDMQRMFGRILAGEIRRPTSFSIKAVKIMGDIDRSAAALFRKLCSACIVLQVPPGTGHIIDARVPSLGGNASSNALQKYGLGFSQLNVLHEYGLIIADYNSYMGYEMCIANEGKSVAFGFLHQGSEWGLCPAEDRAKDAKLRVHGVALSQAGRELLKIVDLEPTDSYTADLRAYFEKNKLKLMPVLRQPGT